MVKQSTTVHAAIRNVGDSSDFGQAKSGTLKECLVWMVQELSKATMKKRFQISLARDESEAMVGLGFGKNHPAQTKSVVDSLIDDVFEGVVFDDEDESSRSDSPGNKPSLSPESTNPTDDSTDDYLQIERLGR